MAKAIRIHETGGPEVMHLEEVNVGEPGVGEVRLRVTAVGVNFIDIYQRIGLYALPSMPSGLGLEGAGVVDAVGAGVSGVQPGDRMAYAGGPAGAYASARLIPARYLVKLPESLEDEDAARIMLKGLTTHYLLRRTFPVKKGDTILLHAAAGGVGLLACQWASYLGATIIGTVGDEEKAQLAKANGCDHVILYRQENVPAKVREITAGKGVNVVYDSVGKTTFMDSLDCLSPLGMMVSFGQSSGSVPPFDPTLLAQKGSLFLTRPSLWHYVAEEEKYRQATGELFDLLGKGVLKVHRGGSYALADAPQAHRDLESRKTSGALALTL